MAERHLNPDSRWLLALLAALVALGPLSVDMYLPAMPAMKADLGTSTGAMHLTLSAYLAGFAIFHLACGPLADRFGRKPILTAGTLLFVAGCAGCALSSRIEELLGFRFLQGIGACVGPSLARAIVRDVFGPTRAARALSLMAMLMALAPAVAPGLGGLMLLLLPWSSIFAFLAGYGIVMIVLVRRFLPETLPERQSLHPVAIARNYGKLLVDPFYLLVTLASALVYAGLMAYLSSSSFVYIEMLGVPVEYFGFVFVTAVAGYMAGSAISARLAARYDSEHLLLMGSLASLVASLAMLTGSSLLPGSVLVLMLPMMIYSTGLGLVLPHGMAIALRPFPLIAATASALLGFIQMSLSAAASGLVGLFLQQSPAPMLWAMVLINATAVALALRVYQRHRTTRH